MVGAMTRKRPGHHDCLFQIPDVIWESLGEEAAQKRESLSRLVVEVLRRHCRIPLERIPPPRKPGRKPKVT